MFYSTIYLTANVGYVFWLILIALVLNIIFVNGMIYFCFTKDGMESYIIRWYVNIIDALICIFRYAIVISMDWKIFGRHYMQMYYRYLKREKKYKNIIMINLWNNKKKEIKKKILIRCLKWKMVCIHNCLIIAFLGYIFLILIILPFNWYVMFIWYYFFPSGFAYYFWIRFPWWWYEIFSLHGCSHCYEVISSFFFSFWEFCVNGVVS